YPFFGRLFPGRRPAQQTIFDADGLLLAAAIDVDKRGRQLGGPDIRPLLAKGPGSAGVSFPLAQLGRGHFLEHAPRAGVAERQGEVEDKAAPGPLPEFFRASSAASTPTRLSFWAALKIRSRTWPALPPSSSASASVNTGSPLTSHRQRQQKRAMTFRDG